MPARPKTPKDQRDEAAVATLDGDKPAEAAAAEALADSDEIIIDFRGAEFKIERDILRSARFLVAIASGQDHRILFEIIGPANVDRFMAVLQRGEDLPTVAAEFLGAVGKAAGWGNS